MTKPAARPLLTLRNLAFGRGEALSAPISLEVSPGKILAILGSNGRGKTTLLDTIAGILHPLSGDICRYARIGFVPQQFSTTLAYSVLDIVLMGRAREIGTFELPKPEDEAAAMKALHRLGLEELAERDFRRLSGGQQQLVVIARALAGGAELLLLDEPTAALDLKRQETVLSLMESLAARGTGIIFTTHEPLHAGLVADDALLMLPGEQSLYGSADEILTPENLFEAYGVRIDAVAGKASRRLIPDFESAEPCLRHEAEGFLRFEPPAQGRRARCHEKHPVSCIHVFVCRDLQRPEALGRIVPGIGGIGKEDVGLARKKNLLHRNGLSSLPRHRAADKRAGFCTKHRRELLPPARREVEKLLRIVPARIRMRGRRADPKSGS